MRRFCNVSIHLHYPLLVFYMVYNISPIIRVKNFKLMADRAVSNIT